MWRAVLVAMLVLAPSARADGWRGQTSQGRPASVMTGGDGVVSRVRLSWRAPCGSHHRFASASVLLPPFASASASSVADAGTYRVTDRRGLHARITVRVVGALGSSDWTGTLGVAVMVSHRGKVVDTCRASRLTWSAAPVG